MPVFQSGSPLGQELLLLFEVFFLIVLNKLYVLNIINNKKTKLFMIITLYKHQLNSNISKIHLSCYVSAHLLGVMYHILLIWFKSPPSPEALPVYTR